MYRSHLSGVRRRSRAFPNMVSVKELFLEVRYGDRMAPGGRPYGIGFDMSAVTVGWI